MKSIKIFSLLITLVILAVLATGCKNQMAPTSSDVSQQTGSTISDDNSDTSDISSGNSSNEGNNSSKTNSSKTNSSKTGSSSGTQSGGSVSNMGGYEIVFGTAFYSTYLNASNTIDTSHPIIKKMKELETKYNCKITIKNYSNPTTVANTILAAVMSGDKPCDILEAQVNQIKSIASQGGAYNLASLQGINLSKSDFDKAVTEMLTFNGKTYGTRFGNNTNLYGVFFNKDLIKKYSPSTDIYALYKSGNWTWSEFEKICAATTKDTDGDSKPNIYGVVSNTGIIGMALSSNAGGTATRINGKIVATMCEQTGIDALNWMKRIYNAGNYGYKAQWKDAMNAFVEGSAAMFPFASFALTSDIGTKAEFDFGFVPFPKGPAQSKHIASVYDANTFMIPKTVTKSTYAATILNGLAETDSALKTSLLEKYKNAGLDNDGVEAYKWMMNNMTSEFSGGISFGENTLKIDESVLVATKEPASVIASIKVSVQKILDDYYAAFNKLS